MLNYKFFNPNDFIIIQISKFLLQILLYLRNFLINHFFHLNVTLYLKLLILILVPLNLILSKFIKRLTLLNRFLSYYVTIDN